MKNLFWIIFLGLFIGYPMETEAQILKKLKKKAERKIERKVEEKVEQEIESLFEEGQGSEKGETETTEDDSPGPQGVAKGLELYSRYDTLFGSIDAYLCYFAAQGKPGAISSCWPWGVTAVRSLIFGFFNFYRLKDSDGRIACCKVTIILPFLIGFTQ